MNYSFKDTIRCGLRIIIILTLFLISAFLMISTLTFAVTPEPPSIPQNYVMDLAGILRDDVEAQLNLYLKELEQKTTAQVVILTIQSLDGEDIEGFSLRMAEKWKLGQKGKDNGLLITIALRDKKYRFEIGYGLESILPDSLVGSIGREHLVPYFKKGDYSTGILYATIAVTKIIAASEGVEITEMPKIKDKDKRDKEIETSNSIIIHLIKIFGVIFIIIIIIFIILLYFTSRSSKHVKRGRWASKGSVDRFGLLLVGWGIGQYNKVVAMDEQVKSQWAQVENQLKRRYDLIPNLVETVKGYAKHEKEIFEHIAEARTKYFQAQTPAEKIKASNELEGVLSRLLVLRETYPQLKANENFLKLQDSLEGTENRISVERKRYNEAVKALNTYRRTVYGRIFSAIAGVREAMYYEIPAKEKEAPKVKF